MSNQTLYPNIIANAQRNANVGLQGSTLMGGNLAQSFNLQALRTVKGRVIANASTTNVLLNEYDGTPVTLAPGDFVIAITLANGNPTPDGSASPYAPTAFTAGTVRLQTAAAPTLTNGVWVAGANVQPLMAAASTFAALPSLSVNNGAIIPITMATPAADAQWINCVSASVTPTGNNFVHVTMLVINSALAQ
jgi:hypothetical protein